VHATVRRLKTQPGKVAEVAALIQAEYVPLLDGVDGFVSYTLVDLGDDEVSSMGLFETESSAREANELARTWVADRLGPLVASPLQAAEGTAVVHSPNT
jgi:hypothetical protein